MNDASKKMRIGGEGQRFLGLAVLAALVSVPACASLLGIEDIHEDPSANAGAGNSSIGGTGNSTSEGGKSNPGGGANPGGGSNPTGGEAGEGPSGGANSGGTGVVGGAAGAAAGNAGSNAGGSAGVAGAGGAGTSVHGHVIDFWGHKLSAVPVQIGSTRVTTDSAGAFVIDNAPAQYDASLVVTYTDYGRVKTRGWVYQGLIRRDPTLQVYDALPQVTAPVDIKPNNPAALNDMRTLTVALGGPDVSQTDYDVSGAGTDGTSVIWQGPTTTQATAHALIWENGGDGFPAKFIAYNTTTLALSSLSSVHVPASFMLSANPIAIAMVSGSVAGANFSNRNNSVFLRFSSSAIMQLLTTPTMASGFSYTVPSITGSTITFAASQGDTFTEYGIAHKDGLLPGAMVGNLAIPAPAKGLAVTPSTDLNKVSATTQFTFMAGGTTAPFVAVLTGGDPSVSDDRLYLVSSKAPFTLPKVVGGMYALQPGSSYVFRVETHGAPASVDEMAGPTGFLDAFSSSDYADTPAGPRTGDGSYTLSSVLNVKAAP